MPDMSEKNELMTGKIAMAGSIMVAGYLGLNPPDFAAGKRDCDCRQIALHTRLLSALDPAPESFIPIGQRERHLWPHAEGICGGYLRQTSKRMSCARAQVHPSKRACRRYALAQRARLATSRRSLGRRSCDS